MLSPPLNKKMAFKNFSSKIKILLDFTAIRVESIDSKCKNNEKEVEKR